LRVTLNGEIGAGHEVEERFSAAYRAEKKAVVTPFSLLSSRACRSGQTRLAAPPFGIIFSPNPLLLKGLYWCFVLIKFI